MTLQMQYAVTSAMIVQDVMMITYVIYDTSYVCHYYTCNLHYAGEMDGVLVMEWHSKYNTL